MSIQYVHTNIIAKDWKALASFYVDVFDCTPIYPERDLSGNWVEKLTNIKDCKIKGVHLALPGYINGPTLEIFSYEPENELRELQQLNRIGFAHIAFHVDNVEEMLDKLILHGGKQYGDLVKNTNDKIGELTVVYACDPEENIIEIQNWNKKAVQI